MTKISIFLFLFTLNFGLSNLFSQEEFYVCQKIESVHNALKKFHFNDFTINEIERKEIIVLFFKEADPNNQFFTVENLVETQKIASEKGLCEAFKNSIQTYRNAISTYDSISKSFFLKPVILSKTEFLTLNSANTQHLRALKKNYKKELELNLKFEYLNSVYSKFEADSSLKKIITTELDQEIRAKLSEKEKKYITRKLENWSNVEGALLEDFLNAIALRFDPHSSYFSIQTKEAFEQELSSEKLVYGIQFNENEDFSIEVTDITPGSSAWKSNEISVGDIILEIIDHKGTKHDLTSKGISNLTQILGNSDSKTASFKIKHKNGGISIVKLVKSKIENIENSFTGYLLNDKNSKVGYIALPSFYTDFEGDTQLGCANDVAKEIILLKKDSIQGLIIDLRNNGGGSLKEAIELSGLFIDEGPMSIYQTKDEKPYLLKDMNRGTVYNGPLIVLVNSMSASASEFFAGCMQDYQRALIVGDRTYGKGTAQGVYPVSNEQNNTDFVKVTNGKFYHVSSRSNQEIGITPDIQLNDIYSELDYFLESNEQYHLKNDSTAKKIIYKIGTIKEKGEVLKRSSQRMEASLPFKKMKIKASNLAAKVQEDQKIPLDLNGFLAYKKGNELFWKDLYQNDEVEIMDFDIKNHSFAKKLLSLDENEKLFNDRIKIDLKNDLLIQESFLIFKDILNLGL